MMHSTPSELLQHAEDAARIAGAILREGFGKPLLAESKEGMHNLVTEYDLRAETAILDHLRARTPGASFMAEESGHELNDNSLIWVIDPLDGTVNFAHGIPIFCVSIAAVLHDAIVCGAIYNPLTDEMFSARNMGGAFLNGNALRVSSVQHLHDAILVTGFPYNVSENPLRCIDQFSAVVGKGLPVRRLGSAALDLAYTAAGRFDGFWESILQPWDMAAGVLLVQESGGRVTHYGSAPFTLSRNSLIATNGNIHDELSNLLELGT
ncbi:MAG: inositol monophosphatase family protein [Ignavibacteria bacterium]|jgi:myo-inositol-1(or 4)-monophosphatase